MIEYETVKSRARCPYRDKGGVTCGHWKDKELAAVICPHCGWNPEEEERRKALLRSGKVKSFLCLTNI